MSAAVLEPAGAVGVEEYRAWLLGVGMSAYTAKQRVRFAAARLREWGTWDVSPAVVAEWLAQHEGWSRRTYLSHLRSLYAFLVEVGAVPVDPTARIRRGPAPGARPNPLTEFELATLLDAATGNVRTWLLLGSKAGLRRFEIAKVRGEDIRGDFITIHGKGGVVERVPLHRSLQELAAEYPASGWWFPSPLRAGQPITSSALDQAVRRLFKAHGISGCSHRLRHTFGTQLAANGTPLHVVQKLMRHASLETTQLYLGVDENARSSAIDGL